MVRHKYQHVKRGKRRIGEREFFFKSELEYHVALFLLATGYEFEYEPMEFRFPVERGVMFYRPDFQAWPKDRPKDYKWVEVKGYLDATSKTRLRRFAQYYPEEARRLVIVTDSKEAQTFVWEKINGDIAPFVEFWSARKVKRIAICLAGGVVA